MPDKSIHDFGVSPVGVRIKGNGAGFYTGFDASANPIVGFYQCQGSIQLEGDHAGSYLIIYASGSLTPLQQIIVPYNAPIWLVNNRYVNDICNIFKNVTNILPYLYIIDEAGGVHLDLSGATGIQHTVSLASSSFGGASIFATVTFAGCTNLPGISANSGTVNMTSLDLTGCTGMESFPDVGDTFIMGSLNLTNCTQMFTLRNGLRNLESIILTGVTALAYADFSACAFPESQVDYILAHLAGETGIPNGTCDLSGFNAIPSAAGLANKAILEANGWTVTVNS